MPPRESASSAYVRNQPAVSANATPSTRPLVRIPPLLRPGAVTSAHHVTSHHPPIPSLMPPPPAIKTPHRLARPRRPRNPPQVPHPIIRPTPLWSLPHLVCPIKHADAISASAPVFQTGGCGLRWLGLGAGAWGVEGWVGRWVRGVGRGDVRRYLVWDAGLYVPSRKRSAGAAGTGGDGMGFFRHRCLIVCVVSATHAYGFGSAVLATCARWGRRLGVGEGGRGSVGDVASGR